MPMLPKNINARFYWPTRWEIWEPGQWVEVIFEPAHDSYPRVRSRYGSRLAFPINVNALSFSSTKPRFKVRQCL